MLPNFLLPETVTHASGKGQEVQLDDTSGRLVLLTLGVTRIIEQESLTIEIWGSPDKSDWGTKPLLKFPQKFYCGTYSQLLDLTTKPDIKYLRVDYEVNRWGRGDAHPLFGFYVFAQDSEHAHRRAAVA